MKTLNQSLQERMQDSEFRRYYEYENIIQNKELIESKSFGNVLPRDFFTIGASHIAFTVDDLDKTYQYLLDNGVKFNAPPQKSPDGFAKVTFCSDPDNTPIELVEVISK